MTLLELTCQSHTYPDGTVGIHDVEFAVDEREIVAVCGPNGAGKSTLLEHCNGLLTPDEGELRIDGDPITKQNIERARKTVGFVFQDADTQLVAPTVIDDVTFGPKNFGASDEEARRRAEEALETMDATYLLDRVPHYLSGGEKRLVALAGIAALDPKLIVMDEPLAGLDPARGKRVVAMIERLHNEGVSFVLSTHDIDLAARLADRICLMAEGNVIDEGSPDEVFYEFDLLERANLEPPTPVRVARDAGLPVETRPVTEDDLIALVRTHAEKTAAGPSPES